MIIFTGRQHIACYAEALSL